MATWKKTTLILPSGVQVQASAPLIISASRATDIPAFYASWFMEQLHQGFTCWRNPFNGTNQWLDLRSCLAIVFWSKNPAPLLPYLQQLDTMGYASYILFTLNDYECEGLEPFLPPLEQRIHTFKSYTKRWGRNRVIWRFDPLIKMEGYAKEHLLNRIKYIGNQLTGYTTKLVISPCLIHRYKKVQRNLAQNGIQAVEWKKEEFQEVVDLLVPWCRDWGMELGICADEMGIRLPEATHHKCIDDHLFQQVFPTHVPLQEYLDTIAGRTDPGQRKACSCIPSKDIGQYDTCKHGCVYCYATRTPFKGEDSG
jgi:hypothetical protein